MNHLQLIAALGALALAGCQTMQSNFQPDAAASVANGQVQYVRSGKSIITDLATSRSGNRDVSLVVTAGGGLPLLELTRGGSGRAHAQGVIARGSWKGFATKAPKHLRGWLRVAEKVAAGENEFEVDSPESGERFVVRLTR